MPAANDSIPTTGNTSGSKAMHPLLAWANVRTGAAIALRRRSLQHQDSAQQHQPP